MKTNSDTPRALYLGLDVHKAQTVIATLEDHREARPEIHGSVATSQHALERVIRRIAKARKLPLDHLHVCYEASGCGFWIARLLARLGVSMSRKHCERRRVKTSGACDLGHG